MWHVWIVLPLIFFVAISVAGGAFYAGWDIIGARTVKSETTIDSKTLFELVKLSFGVVAGAGALVALVVAYRRQRVDEDAATRDATRLHTERFGSAVGQLGDSSAAVRLGGVHALSALADDAPTIPLRQTCVDVLCAYLRMPDQSSEGTAERQVRDTILDQIRSHLRSPLDYLTASASSWHGLYFNLKGATLHNPSLSGIDLDNGTVFDFENAVFPDGADFEHITLRELSALDFTSARFSGGMLDFRGASLADASMSFREADFGGSYAVFDGDLDDGGVVTFETAAFTDGQVHIRFPSEDRHGRVAGRVNLKDVLLDGGQITLEADTVQITRGLFEPLPVGLSIAEPPDFSNLMQVMPDPPQSP
ncbi:pentapeptide repeat-containing protein [Streptomyces sp. SGAir0957]